MKNSQHEAEPQRSAGAQSIEALHDRVGKLLMRTLTGRFGMPQDAAEELLRKLLVSAMLTPLADPEGWLIAAACNAASVWQRQHAGAVAPDDATPEEFDAFHGLTITTASLAHLPPPARDAIRLRYVERRTFREIAAELSVAPKYAQTLVMKGLARIRSAQRPPVSEQEP